MNADPILLQKKYTRVVACLAKKVGISLDDALQMFYRSEVYPLLSEGVSDLHCMSDDYIKEEIITEQKENTKKTRTSLQKFY